MLEIRLSVWHIVTFFRPWSMTTSIPTPDAAAVMSSARVLEGRWIGVDDGVVFDDMGGALPRIPAGPALSTASPGASRALRKAESGSLDNSPEIFSIGEHRACIACGGRVEFLRG